MHDVTLMAPDSPGLTSGLVSSFCQVPGSFHQELRPTACLQHGVTKEGRAGPNLGWERDSSIQLNGTPDNTWSNSEL